MNTRSASMKCLSSSLVLVLIAGCAGTGDDGPPPDMNAMLRQLTEQDGRACFFTADVQGSGVLGPGVMSISTRFNREYYLVATATPCAWLTPLTAVGFRSNGPEVCGGGAANVVGDGFSCPIASVFEFPSREDAMTAWELAKAKAEVQQQYQVPGR